MENEDLRSLVNEARKLVERSYEDDGNSYELEFREMLEYIIDSFDKQDGEEVELNDDAPTCPYCGSKTTKETFYDRRCYVCYDCQCLFENEDIEREEIRHRVSLLLDGTDEDNPKECDIIVGEWEAQGLSSLELPHITKCFQVPGDGTMWFHCHGAVNENGEEAWMNFDDFDIHDLRAILEGLENGEA